MIKKFIVAILLFSSLIYSSCKEDDSRDLSIGIFGGSQSISYHSRDIKEKWSKLFNAKITSCGVVGAGFGMGSDNNIANQIKQNPPFDIYLLWCSTNDCGLNELLDNENDADTQSGGLKKSIEFIREKNPKAKILLFTSIWVPMKWIQTKMPIVIKQQVSFCEKYNIPYLNQYECNILVESDFLEDKVHMASSKGYWKLEPNQTTFLQKNIFLYNEN